MPTTPTTTETVTADLATRLLDVMQQTLDLSERIARRLGDLEALEARVDAMKDEITTGRLVVQATPTAPYVEVYSDAEEGYAGIVANSREVENRAIQMTVNQGPVTLAACLTVSDDSQGVRTDIEPGSASVRSGSDEGFKAEMTANRHGAKVMASTTPSDVWATLEVDGESADFEGPLYVATAAVQAGDERHDDITVEVPVDKIQEAES